MSGLRSGLIGKSTRPLPPQRGSLEANVRAPLIMLEDPGETCCGGWIVFHDPSKVLLKFTTNFTIWARKFSPIRLGDFLAGAAFFFRFFDKGLERVTILRWSKAENPIFLPNTSFLTLIKDLIHPPNQPIFVFFFFLMILTNNSVGGMMLYRSIK